MDQPQNTDGIPHFTYYDKTMLLSFVWDGISIEIDVCEGGYGEPVVDHIPVPPGNISLGRNPGRWLAWFQVQCEIYIKEKYPPRKKEPSDDVV
jgi:hypothetical protein